VTVTTINSLHVDSLDYIEATLRESEWRRQPRFIAVLFISLPHSTLQDVREHLADKDTLAPHSVHSRQDATTRFRAMYALTPCALAVRTEVAHTAPLSSPHWRRFGASRDRLAQIGWRRGLCRDGDCSTHNHAESFLAALEPTGLITRVGSQPSNRRRCESKPSAISLCSTGTVESDSLIDDHSLACLPVFPSSLLIPRLVFAASVERPHRRTARVAC